jgi:hypothetical protein
MNKEYHCFTGKPAKAIQQFYFLPGKQTKIWNYFLVNMLNHRVKNAITIVKTEIKNPLAYLGEGQ